MPEPLVVIGAGGFGRETIAMVAAIRDSSGCPTYEVVGVADDDPTERDAALLAGRGVPVLGGVEEAATTQPGAAYVVAVGSPSAREALAARADAAGWRGAVLVHPTATVSDPSSVVIGDGSVLCAHSMVTNDMVLGRHTHLNGYAYVGHDSTLGDFVTVSPRAGTLGGTHLEDRVFLGTNATVLPGVRMGADSVAGAASCVTRDVAPGQVVKGIPAR